MQTLRALARVSVLLWAATSLGFDDGTASAATSSPPAFLFESVPKSVAGLVIDLPESSVELMPSPDTWGIEGEMVVLCRGALPTDSCRRAADALRWKAVAEGDTLRLTLHAGPTCERPASSRHARRQGWAEIELRLRYPEHLPLRVEMSGAGSLRIGSPRARLDADAGEGVIDFRVDRSTLGPLRIDAPAWSLPRHARRKASEPVALVGDGDAAVSLRAAVVRLGGDRPTRVEEDPR